MVLSLQVNLALLKAVYSFSLTVSGLVMSLIIKFVFLSFTMLLRLTESGYSPRGYIQLLCRMQDDRPSAQPTVYTSGGQPVARVLQRAAYTTESSKRLPSLDALCPNIPLETMHISKTLQIKQKCHFLHSWAV